MRAHRIITAALALVTLSAAGCVAARLGTQQRQLHRQMLRSYDEQLLINLARAYYGLPVVHYQYGAVTNKTTGSSSITGGYDGEKDGDGLTVTTKDDGTQERVSIDNEGDGWNVSGTLNVGSELSYAATPITDPAILRAYQQAADELVGLSAFQIFDKRGVLRRAKTDADSDAVSAAGVVIASVVTKLALGTADPEELTINLVERPGATNDQRSVREILRELTARVMYPQPERTLDDNDREGKVLVTKADPGAKSGHGYMVYTLTTTPKLGTVDGGRLLVGSNPYTGTWVDILKGEGDTLTVAVPDTGNYNESTFTERPFRVQYRLAKAPPKPKAPELNRRSVAMFKAPPVTKGTEDSEGIESKSANGKLKRFAAIAYLLDPRFEYGQIQVKYEVGTGENAEKKTATVHVLLAPGASTGDAGKGVAVLLATDDPDLKLEDIADKVHELSFRRFGDGLTEPPDLNKVLAAWLADLQAD